MSPRAANTCGHPITSQQPCGATQGVRPYLNGPRCPTHTPAALAGRAEPHSVPHPGGRP